MPFVDFHFGDRHILQLSIAEKLDCTKTAISCHTQLHTVISVGVKVQLKLDVFSTSRVVLELQQKLMDSVARRDCVVIADTIHLGKGGTVIHSGKKVEEAMLHEDMRMRGHNGGHLHVFETCHSLFISVF